MNHTRLVDERNEEGSVRRLVGRQPFAECVDIGIGEFELRVQRLATRFEELDRGRLVPDREPVAEDPLKHRHVHRIDRAVEASAERGADAVFRPPAVRHPNANVPPVRTDVIDPSSGSAIGGKEVEPVTPQPGTETLPRRVLTKGAGVRITIDAGGRVGHVRETRRRRQTRVGTGDNP